MPYAKISLYPAAWLLLALSSFLLARLAPPLAGLSLLSQSVLGTAFAGTVLWVSEALPLGLTALIVMLLLGLCHDMRFPEIAGGLPVR
jgi:solute carrier family 13 (sodium-dependent dicarboxylate transporter), member 2/3/5